MGTMVTITVVAAPDAARRALDAGFAEIARLEAIFSSYRSNSELSRLNRHAGGAGLQVSAEFIELTRRALAIARLTGGAFNPLVGPAVKLWGIPENPQIPDQDALSGMTALLDLDEVRVDPQAGTVALARPGMALGLGGVAKGYSADRVYQILIDAGVQAGIVAVAGDVRVFGQRPDGRPWSIGVRDPNGEVPLMTLPMTDGGISTSGDYERYFEIDGVRYHHILDPRTLYPARSGVSGVTVRANDATLADGLATALFVMGVQAGLARVNQLEGVEALFVDATGGQHVSAGWSP